jgi:tetrahydromethanopterin S-methyltransferase subunit G
MDDTTLEVILSRFDKLDAKIDRAIDGQASLASRVTAVETKVDPVVSEATFQRRTRYVGHVLSGSIGAGLIAAWQYLFPHARLK